MVATTSSLSSGNLNLDGFSNLDVTAGTASVLFGGANDGSVQIVVKGFTAAPSWGSTVQYFVDHTPWVNRTTVVTATDILATGNLPIAN